ncbi:unnamed protein product [Rotaria sp. Silwood1]|nr:unnamed protein product [Rotaria sp. Silwood1]
MSGIDLAISKQAIGRHGFIGSLYDIRSDQFEGGNLFNRELASSLISTTDCASSDFYVDENLSQKDTLNKLNIEGSMKLSLMAGLVKVDGSAKYLNQTKTDSQTVRVTLMFNVKTKQQHLQVSMADLYNYFIPDALENPNATHCITGIMWGARVAATFEQALNNSEAAEELQGLLSASLKKATVNVEGQAKLENVEQANSKFRSLKISFSGDVLIDDVPHTVDDVFNIFKKVPSMLKQLNEGKGKQLEFQLYPLKRMAEIFKYELRIEKRIIKEIANHMIHSIENVFEEIHRGKRIINDFLAKIEQWKDFISPVWTDVIHMHQRKLVDAEGRTQRDIALLLERIRRGEANENEIIDLLNDFYEKKLCSPKSIDRFLKENARINAKIEALSRFDQMTIEKGLDSGRKEPNLSILLKKMTTIEDLIDKYYDDNIYLLHIAYEWEEKDKQNWYKQLRYFNNLQKVEMQREEKKSIFRVIDHDLYPNLHDKPETCLIYHAFRGNIKSKDYYHTSHKKCESEEVVL